MSRERLTTKVAGDIVGDVYTMNNPDKEKNDPKIDEYANGNPSAWGEDVNTANPAKNDEASRDKATHFASSKDAAQAAVKTAAQLERKAVKCIVAAQRMLPGAEDAIIEAQAADLMELPETSLNATLARQERLAQSIIAKADEVVEEVTKEEEEKTAASEAQKAARAKFLDMIKEKKDKAAKLAAEIDELEKSEKEATDDKDEDDKEEKEAAKEVEDDKEEKEAAKEVEDDKEEKEAAKEVEEKDEESKEASDNLLDQIFASVQASDNKKGASSLSGIVKKQASESSDELAGLWGPTPDVSHIFG